MNNQQLICQLKKEHNLTDNGLIQLLKTLKKEDEEMLFAAAREERERIYGKDVYIRGLIEFSNICKNDCFYCGIRKSNHKIERYRLTPEDILECAAEGYALGFRTFVLQGGEDAWFSEKRMEQIIRALKEKYPDCAVTLSVGERTREEYECWFEAGADRFLLRHETATEEHYKQLHPYGMQLSQRKKCLFDLKEIGYQVGAGFMVGSPAQTLDNLVADLRFLQELQPHMIGIGPFLSHQDTPFAKEPNGSFEQTLVLLAMIRLLFPKVLLPATTALGTIVSDGRERGLLAGANVVMPNLSPVAVRKKYSLYDNKIATGEEAAQGIELLKKSIEKIGYRVVCERGDSLVESSNSKF